MRSILKRILFGLVGTYLSICLVVFVFQRSLLYHPGAPPTRDPGGQDLAWRDLTLETEDGEQIHAWLIEAEVTRGCILVSHGNAGSLEHRITLAKVFNEMGFSTLLYDYRGFGRSTGSPSEEGTYADGTAAYQWLIEEGWTPEQIVFWGESLGGGVATELATRFPGAALVLDHTFASAVEAGSDVYPWLPVRLLARDRYDSLTKIARLSLPILIMHSLQDELIPFAQAEELFAAAPSGTELLVLEGKHNDPGFRMRARFMRQVEQFLRDSVSES